MAILAIVVSVISASYYLKIIRVLHSEPLIKIKVEESKKNIVLDSNLNSECFNKKLTNFHSFIIATLTLFILLFIIKPSILLNSTQLLSLSLFNF